MKTLSFSSALKDVIAACQNDLEVIKDRRATMKARLDNAAAVHGIDPAAVGRFLRKAEKNEINRDRNDEIDAIYKVIANGGVPALPSRSDIELDRVMELTNTDKPPKIKAIKQAIGCSQGKAQKLRKSAAARLAAKSSSSCGIDEYELLAKQDRPSDGPRLGKLQKRQIELLERAAAKKATLPHEPETGEIAAKSSSSRGIDEHELLTKQDRPSDGPRLGKLQKRQIDLLERAAAKKATLTGEIAAKSSSSRGIDEHELLTKQDRPSDGPRVGELQKRQIEPLEYAAVKKATLPHEPETGEIVEPRKGADDDGLEIPNFLKRPLPARMVTP